MSTRVKIHDQVLFPPDASEAEERGLWNELQKALERADDLGGGQVPVLVTHSGEHIKLPQDVFRALRLVVEAVNRGLPVVVNPQEAWISTQQAAGMLGVSRMTLIRWLDEGRLDYTQPGRHRKLKLEDVLEFKAHRTASQHKVLDAITAEEMRDGTY